MFHLVRNGFLFFCAHFWHFQKSPVLCRAKGDRKKFPPIPLVVLILLGVIYGNKPASPGAEYTFLEQPFGVLTTIAICAGGVMGLPLVVSDYRNKKIWKRFKVTPVSPAMILAVQVPSLLFLAAIYWLCC